MPPASGNRATEALIAVLILVSPRPIPAWRNAHWRETPDGVIGKLVIGSAEVRLLQNYATGKNNTAYPYPLYNPI
jgi:hypothetical protein